MRKIREVLRLTHGLGLSVRQVSEATGELFHKGQRIASHMRSHLKHKHSTTPEHMPSSHRRYAEWSPARMLCQARKIQAC